MSAPMPGLTQSSAGPPFVLAATDREMAAAAQANLAAGYLRPRFGIASLYDKHAQHAAVREIDTAWCFDSWVVDSVDELPSLPGEALVIRPTVSPHSKGSAVVVGPSRPLDAAERERLKAAGGPYMVHVHEPGQPLFVNGVLSGQALTLSDAWRCVLVPVGCRDILVAVTKLPLAALPLTLPGRLETLCIELGLRAGPVHVELVLTRSGPKLVKLAPRLATQPLPALCALAGEAGQVALFEQARRARFTEVLAPVAQSEVMVADYSFICFRGGVVRRFAYAAEVERLKSFDSYYQPAHPGQSVQATTDGNTYGVTIFLKHRSAGQIDADVKQLSALNRPHAIELA